MNLYPLSDDITLSAKYTCDLHLFRGVISAAQILSAGFHILQRDTAPVIRKDGKYLLCSTEILPPVGKQNPWVQWAIRRKSHHDWVKEYARAMHEELWNRFGAEVHAMQEEQRAWVLLSIWGQQGLGFLYSGEGRASALVTEMEPFPLNMPVQFTDFDTTPIEQYRTYYKHLSKQMKMRWSTRCAPYFLQGVVTK